MTQVVWPQEIDRPWIHHCVRARCKRPEPRQGPVRAGGWLRSRALTRGRPACVIARCKALVLFAPIRMVCTLAASRGQIPCSQTWKKLASSARWASRHLLSCRHQGKRRLRRQSTSGRFIATNHGRLCVLVNHRRLVHSDNTLTIVHSCYLSQVGPKVQVRCSAGGNGTSVLRSRLGCVHG